MWTRNRLWSRAVSSRHEIAYKRWKDGETEAKMRNAGSRERDPKETAVLRRSFGAAGRWLWLATVSQSTSTEIVENHSDRPTVHDRHGEETVLAPPGPGGSGPL